MDNVYQIVEQELIKACRGSVGRIDNDVNFFNDLGLDSIDFINVVYEIDFRFGIKVPVGRWMSEVNEGEADMSQYFVMGNFVDAVQTLISNNG